MFPFFTCDCHTYFPAFRSLSLTFRHEERHEGAGILLDLDLVGGSLHGREDQVKQVPLPREERESSLGTGAQADSKHRDDTHLQHRASGEGRHQPSEAGQRPFI